MNRDSDSLIFGIGRGNRIISSSFNTIDEEHNLILQILLDSGLIGVGLFSLLLIMIGFKIKKYKDYTISKIISISIFSYLIVGLMESVFYKREFWILLVLGYGIDKIIHKLKRDKVINVQR